MTQPTLKPGVYADVPFDEYAAWPAINASLLKLVADCPAEAEWHMRYGRETTAAMTLGKACHHALLEPGTFADHFVVAEQCQGLVKSGDRAGKPCGNAGAVCRNNVWYCGVHDPDKGKPKEDGRDPISAAEWNACEYVRSAVLRDKLIGKLFRAADALREASLYWLDPETGEPCKARVDLLVASYGAIFDLKTTGLSSRPQAVKHAARRFGFGIQAAHNLAGCAVLKDALGEDVTEFVYGAIKSKPPNILTPMQMTAAALELGEFQRRAAIETFIRCRDSDHWPGYIDGELGQIDAADIQTADTTEMEVTLENE